MCRNNFVEGGKPLNVSGVLQKGNQPMTRLTGVNLNLKFEYYNLKQVILYVAILIDILNSTYRSCSVNFKYIGV